MSTVFGDDPGFLYGNIGGFTQAADDTREVINFMHDHPLPVGSETPVPLCDDSSLDTDDVYDVSISEESGLQVPKRMVADAEEGREIIVTVANAGPDDRPRVEYDWHRRKWELSSKTIREFRVQSGGGTERVWSEWLYQTLATQPQSAGQRRPLRTAYVRPEHGQQYRHRDHQGDDNGVAAVAVAGQRHLA